MIHQVAAIVGTLQAEKRLKEAKKKAQEQDEGTDEDGRMK